MTSAPVIASASDPRHPLRLLLVEDDTTYRSLVRCWIHHHGPAEIVCEDRIASALGRIERESFDAMIIDLSLNDSEATSTLHSILLLVSHIPIIVLTGCDDPGLMNLATKIGIAEFRVKQQTGPQDVVEALSKSLNKGTSRHVSWPDMTRRQSSTASPASTKPPTAEKTPAHLSAPETGSAKSDTKTSSRQSSPARRVLIVEDDIDLETVFQRAARTVDADLELDWAVSVSGAMELLRRREYDLIVSDYRLNAGGSGYELQKWCKQFCPEITYAMMSAMSIDEYLHRFPDESIPFLSKPFSISELRGFLRARLN